jgi:hypothetical protein
MSVSLYDFEAETVWGTKFDFRCLLGDASVVLLINVASK